MNKFTIFQKLDIILSHFRVDELSSGLHNLQIKEKVDIAEMGINNDLLNEILYKLTKDGYLRIEVGDAYVINHGSIPDINYYYLTIEGQMFKENGGYEKEKEFKDLQTLNVAQEKKRNIRNERLIVRGTWAAAIVAFLVLIFYVLTYLYPAKC